MRKTICRMGFENTFLASTAHRASLALLPTNNGGEAIATWAIMAENTTF